MPLEVIATTVADAKAIEASGAHRIELISGPLEGGLTPTPALVEAVKEAVSIPVHAMLRPHAQSFIYDQDDQTVILEEAVCLRKAGADAVVFGALTNDRRIDLLLLEGVLDKLKNVPVTFHRAIDDCYDLPWEVQRLSQYSQVKWILSSGGQPDAMTGLDMIRNMTLAARTAAEEKNREPVVIMGGAGLTLGNMQPFLEQSDCEWVHIGRAAREGNDFMKPVSQEAIAQFLQLVSQSEMA